MAALPGRASDLVRDSKLNATIAKGITQHVSYVSDPSATRGRAKLEESWRWQRDLGAGTFGRVWLERCVEGPEPNRLRAVKAISKNQSTIEHERELEAIAKFSHENVCALHLFRD
jgi:hypothetical protein